jgi:DNA mismatch repair protein MSH4
MANHEELKDAEKDLNQVLMIKAYLGGIRVVQETLEVTDCTSKLCKWVLERCRPEHTAPVFGLIEEAIEQDAIYSKAPIDVRNNRLWAVKVSASKFVLPRPLLTAFFRSLNLMECWRALASCTEIAQTSCTNMSKSSARHFKVRRRWANNPILSSSRLTSGYAEHLGTAPELRLANDNHYYLRFQWSEVEREIMRQQTGTESGESSRVRHWRPRPLGGVGTVNGIRRKQHYDCQTLELIQRSSQIQRHADIITGQSDRFVVDLKKSLMEHAESLLAVNEAIAVLDMLSSFAYLATTQNYARPIISDNLVLKGARHPVVEVRKPNFVPNDVYSGDDGARFQIVTGGNMSGKSTFIRTVALIQVMAQVGSFVPATYAGIPICDRLFTRLSTEDKPESNLGTFAVEMTEMNMVLRYQAPDLISPSCPSLTFVDRQITKDSLVIIDELGRGTSTKEGLAVALAMSEKLIETGCRVFFATHFTELGKINRCD